MTDDPLVRERLLPRWWAWLLPVGVVAMVGIAYGAALGAAAGWIVTLIGLVIVILLMWITAPVVAVSPDTLVVGPATLPTSSIASVDVVTAADIARLRGPQADARVYTALRPWSARDGVLVTLDDPTDPHPAWLFSSRDPRRVVEALAATMDAGTGTRLEDA